MVPQVRVRSLDANLGYHRYFTIRPVRFSPLPVAASCLLFVLENVAVPQLDFKFHVLLCVVILSEVRRQPNGVESLP